MHDVPLADLCGDRWSTAFWVHDAGHSEPSKEWLLQDAGRRRARHARGPGPLQRWIVRGPGVPLNSGLGLGRPWLALAAWCSLAHVLKMTLSREAPGCLASSWLGALHRCLGHR